MNRVKNAEHLSYDSKKIEKEISDLKMLVA